MTDYTKETKFLDSEFNQYSGASTGFEAKVSSEPYPVTEEEYQAAQGRYGTIKSFQTKVIDLFRASLRGDADSRIASGVLGDVMPGMAEEYHRKISDTVWETPAFFRTDEAKLGKLTEIQCSGSGWDLNQVIYEMYQKFPEKYGRPQFYKRSLAQSFAHALNNYLNDSPIVHHLADNASRPHGARYFIQKTRQQGVKYFGYDSDVRAHDCNFLRSHDFYSIIVHNFHEDRLERCVRGEMKYDLPPIALFDCKYIMAWPFWSLTRNHFSDAERDLFPHTVVVEADGIETEEGTRLSIDDFCAIPNSQRDFFLKYGGTDVAINWGSKAVFSTKSLSKPRCIDAMQRAVKDIESGRPWVLQKAIFVKEEVRSVESREGPREQANGKWSHFYGPDGLMGLLVMHLNRHKVHGHSETVMSIGY